MGGLKLGRVLVVAGLINVLGLAGNAATSFATDQASGAARWVLPPAVALAGALLTAVVQAVGAAPPQPQPQPSPQPGTPYRPAPPYAPSLRSPAYRPPSAPAPFSPRPRRRSLRVAILVVLVVCGVGALTVTAGVRYAVGYVTGNEAGADRLIQPAAGRAASLTLVVDKVQYTSHFTRVGLVARNAGAGPVSLPLFDNCVFTGQDGTTLQADASRSRWSTTVPSGGVQRGTVIFGGTLPGGVTRASLSFSTVFSADAGSITVRSLQIRDG